MAVRGRQQAHRCHSAVEEALKYVQDNVKAGSFKFANQLDSGWGGEAFGTQKAAMTIEGNWIKGAVKNDYPDLKYTTVELPRARRARGPSSSPSAGASPRTPRPRRRPSTS